MAITYPFIQAKHFTAGRNGKKPKIIVIHTMETPQSEGRANQVALWFAGSSAPQASAHYMVDDKEVVQSVKEADTAWAVDDQMLNQESISIEHVFVSAPLIHQALYLTVTLPTVHLSLLPMVTIQPVQRCYQALPAVASPLMIVMPMSPSQTTLTMATVRFHLALLKLI